MGTAGGLRPAWSAAFERGALATVTVPDLGVTGAWALDGGAGAGVDVAIVDSGIDAAHPEVGPVASASDLTWDPVGERVVLDDRPHGDVFGHGTACAGIVRRAAPQCRLHSVRVLGSQLSGKAPVFAAGLRRALSLGRVVNLSLSTGRPEYFGVLHELADQAAFTGVILVCAVNNVPTPSYPSQFSSVISVAANDGSGIFDLDCNPGPPADFGAPGIDVRVPWLNGTSIVTTGNSFAAAHVTGLVARLLGKHPYLTTYEVKTVLRALSRNSVIAD